MQPEMHDESSDQQDVPAPVPGVRYKGSANTRAVYLFDLKGITPEQHGNDDYLSWDRGNGHFIPWGHFVDACGSPERALEFLSVNKFDFVAEEVDLTLPEEEEFSIGGVVQE